MKETPRRDYRWTQEQWRLYKKACEIIRYLFPRGVVSAYMLRKKVTTRPRLNEDNQQVYNTALSQLLLAGLVSLGWQCQPSQFVLNETMTCALTVNGWGVAAALEEHGCLSSPTISIIVES